MMHVYLQLCFTLNIDKRIRYLRKKYLEFYHTIYQQPYI